MSTKSTTDALKQKAKQHYNLNYQYILKLDSPKLIAKFKAANKKYYKEMLAQIAKIPASVQKCAPNICCTDVKVSGTEVPGYIEKLYNLTLQIQKALPKPKPGGVCRDSGCAARQKAVQALSKWLKSQAKKLKALEIKINNQLPLTVTQCK